MTARNDITGDKIQSRKTSTEYLDNFDQIFRRKPEAEVVLEYPEDWQPESRSKAISQNGNDGQHYEEIK